MLFIFSTIVPPGMSLPWCIMFLYSTHLHYWPSALIIAPLASGSMLRLEAYDHFQKKSGRNRCTILSSYGPVRLSIPLEKGKHQQMPYREVRISRAEPWHRTHLRTIQSCYGRAPFYDHFIDELIDLYASPDPFLWEWNMRLFHWTLHQIDIPAQIDMSSEWQNELADDILDLRRIEDQPEMLRSHHIRPVPYPQVFQDRHGFTGGLSILDLLFCAGPQARMILREMNQGQTI